MKPFVLFIAAFAASPLFAQGEAVQVPKVAIYPWSFAENERGTNPTAVDTALSTLQKLFEKRAQFEVISPARCAAAWRELGYEELPETVEDPGQLPATYDPKKLLAFGKKVGADYVCAGTLAWRVRSVWVGLGPKTKANAVVNVMIVDVKKAELALDVKGFDSDSTKAEKWYETAGALLVTWGITLFSGGPKTPHMQNAAIKAIGGATDPWFATIGKKIGTDGDGTLLSHERDEERTPAAYSRRT